ncbi:MAG: T9SS type A sorting domain-containing protein [Candidatus Delongbacteria bacterium]|jgi:PKD repeat protein|nr:T9SS type A sorting domain-containing protein [Candidatus Delongbacteria bacterium]
MKRLLFFLFPMAFLTSLSFAQTECEVNIYESIDGYELTVEAMYVEFVDSDTADIADAACDWDFDGDEITDATGTPATYTFSDPGVYEVCVTAEGTISGCIATQCVNVLVDVDPLTIDLDKGWADPEDYDSGYVSATVTGGGEPYTYAWSEGSTTYEITGLSSGTYCVTVTDDYGLTASQCVALTSPYPLEVALSLSMADPEVPCSMVGVAMVSGGIEPYTYEWSNESGVITGETGPTVDALCISDSICVTVTDNVGNTGSDCEWLSGPCASFYASYTTTPASTSETSDGSIDVSVTGGHPPYSYDWSDGNTTHDNTGIMSGTYNVTITDDWGCEEHLSITLGYVSELPTELTIRSFSYVWQIAGSDVTADVSVNIEGGISPFDYTWYQSDGSTTYIDVTHADESETSDMVSGAEPGFNVYVTVTDDAGDNAYGSVDIPLYDSDDPYDLEGSMGAYMDTCLVEDEIIFAHIIDYWVESDILYASWYIEYSTGEDEMLVISYGDVSGMTSGMYEMYLYVDCDVDFKTMTTLSDYIVLDDSMVSVEPVSASTIPQVEVYPNPVRDNVFIKASGEFDNGHIYITDASGRLLISRCIETNRTILKINTVDLPSGMYFLTIEADNTSTVKKIIK